MRSMSHDLSEDIQIDLFSISNNLQKYDHITGILFYFILFYKTLLTAIIF